VTCPNQRVEAQRDLADRVVQHDKLGGSAENRNKHLVSLTGHFSPGVALSSSSVIQFHQQRKEFVRYVTPKLIKLPQLLSKHF
jgi:hypothetical protein